MKVHEMLERKGKHEYKHFINVPWFIGHRNFLFFVILFFMLKALGMDKSPYQSQPLIRKNRKKVIKKFLRWKTSFLTLKLWLTSDQTCPIWEKKMLTVIKHQMISTAVTYGTSCDIDRNLRTKRVQVIAVRKTLFKKRKRTIQRSVWR